MNCYSDEKMLIMSKMAPSNVLSFCTSSNDIYVTCKNNKYGNLWKEKIRKDFGVIVKQGSYEKYKFLKHLYDKKFFIVIGSEDEDDGEILFSYMFDSLEKAERYIFEQIGDKYTYSSMKIALATDTLTHGGIKYNINSSDLKLTKSTESFNEEKEEYEKDEEFLKSISASFLPEGIERIIGKMNEKYNNHMLRQIFLTVSEKDLEKVKCLITIKKALYFFTETFKAQDRGRLKEIILKRMLIDDFVYEKLSSFLKL